MMRALLLSIALCAAPAMGAPAAPRLAPEPPHILVVPFETPAGQASTYWLGEAAAIVLTDDINTRGLGAMTRVARERAFEQLRLPPQAVLSRATVIKVGELIGASEVIVGEVRVDGESLTVRAQPIRIDVGRAASEIVEHGKLADFFAVVQKVARRLVPGEGASAETVPPRQPNGLQAFEAYVKGLVAEQPATQASFLESALKIDPDFHRARLALWEVRNGQGDHAAALAAAKAVPAGAPVSRRARFLSAVSLIALKQYDEAYTLLNQLQDASPDPAIMNDLGVVQLHRTPTPETGKATYFFTKSAERDPDNPDILFNLGYAYALDRDPQGAIYWLREALRRQTTDADAHFVLAAALDAAGNTAEAAREREIARRLSSTYRATARPEPLPRGLERISTDIDMPSRHSGVGQAIAATAQRNQQDVAQFHLERGRRLYQQEQDRDAMAELKRAVFLSPYEAEAHLLIGRIYLRGGRASDAVDALKVSIWSEDTAAAHVALAEAYVALKDTVNARAEAQKALTLDPASEDAKALVQKIGG
jgi:Flp pilus assembly protein TadD